MDHAKCIALIKLYKSKEPLWNMKHPYYRNRVVRERAWKEISKAMSMPLHLLKRKMTMLLASYRTERYRIKKARKSATAGARPYESRWFAFNEFKFMTANITSDDTADTLPDECKPAADTDTTGFDSQVRFANVAAPKPRLPTPRKAAVPRRPARPRAKPRPAAAVRKEQSPTVLREVFDVLRSSACAPTDSYVTYGQHIANELRKYDQTTLSQVKHAINNIIFEADMGMYCGGGRRVENTAGNPTLGPAVGSVLSPTPSMFLAKQENEENEALEVSVIQDASEYYS